MTQEIRDHQWYCWREPCSLCESINGADACCHLHQPQGCCDTDDCGPCCENCPTCPSLDGCKGGHTYEDRCRLRLDDDGTVLHLLSVVEIVL